MKTNGLIHRQLFIGNVLAKIQRIALILGWGILSQNQLYAYHTKLADGSSLGYVVGKYVKRNKTNTHKDYSLKTYELVTQGKTFNDKYLNRFYWSAYSRHY